MSKRAVSFVEEACTRAHLDYAALVAGIDTGANGQVEWDAAAVMLERLEAALGGPGSLEVEGGRFHASREVKALRKIVGGLASSRFLYRAIIGWFGPRLMPFIESSCEDLPDGRLRIEMNIPAALRPCIQLFRFNVGAFRAAPTMLGQPEAIVEAELSPRRGVYIITPPPDLTLFARLKQMVRVAGGPRSAVKELASQQAELRHSYDALLRSRNDLERLTEHMPVGVFVLRDGLVVYANAAGLHSLGLDDASMMRGVRLAELVEPATRKEMEAWLAGTSSPSSRLRDFVFITGESSKVTFELTRPQSLVFGGDQGSLIVARDITATRSLEEQLRQSQKMEAFGSLAGGVAHDFNNMLSVVLSTTSMLIEEADASSPLAADLKEIQHAGERAADLTRQLLAFSRKQVLQPRVVVLGDIVSRMDKLLRRIIGENIELVTLTEPDLSMVRADPGQIEQIIMNFAVNARDAMPSGGKLTIETKTVLLDEPYARDHIGVTPGPHVMLAVTDTGCGFDSTTRARIFEPFFTTKEVGKGTGLGLSTVFGIVQQSGGSIWVYSELGHGSTFKVYLPVVTNAAVPEGLLPPSESLSVGGGETILLVEDEPQVRHVARQILERKGYQVLEANSAADALRISEQHAGSIDLLLTDVVMPKMSGPQLASLLATSRASTPVLYMSGYTDDAIVQHGILEGVVDFISKPLSPANLARKVREVLDRRGRDAPTVETHSRGLRDAARPVGSELRSPRKRDA